MYAVIDGDNIMKLSYVHISNYRNINDISVNFHPESNYIIGENNLGKSNFLTLLGSVCNAKSFEETDFGSPDKPIEITLTLKLLPEEQGFFGDNFSPEDASLLNIRYSQKIDEAHPTIVSSDTGESIQSRQLKKIHFLRYDTNSVPGKVLRLDTTKGAGLIVNSIINRYIANEESTNFLNEEKVGALTTFINEHLEKIRSFSDYDIRATISNDSSEMLSKLFYLSDGERKIDNTGSGVQFMAMASIDILCQIMEIYKSKAIPFEEQLYTNEEGKKILPLVLSIDEPEVHLHPFLQRSLIAYYKCILCNKDNEFKELLNMCFGIDGIDGQLLIVTHSTDILIDDYRNLIRFYKAGDQTKIISGSKLRLTDMNQKHLLMHFPEIKEAFYAHCVILIEGETEYGCITEFADKLGISLNEHAISVINARGENSIKPLRRLLESFSIPCISIYDGDVKQGKIPGEREFFTNELCFEIEIVKNLIHYGRTELVKKVVQEMDSNGENVVLDQDFVKKYFKKMGIDVSAYTPKKLADISAENETEFCNMYSTWYMVKKGILLGRIIGNLLPKELIPECYANAIVKAQEVAVNV